MIKIRTEVVTQIAKETGRKKQRWRGARNTNVLNPQEDFTIAAALLTGLPLVYSHSGSSRQSKPWFPEDLSSHPTSSPSWPGDLSITTQLSSHSA